MSENEHLHTSLHNIDSSDMVMPNSITRSNETTFVNKALNYTNADTTQDRVPSINFEN